MPTEDAAPPFSPLTRRERLDAAFAMWGTLVGVAWGILRSWPAAEDAASITILKAADAQIDNPDALPAWLLTTLRNVCYDVHRRKPSARRLLTRLYALTSETAGSHEDSTCDRAEARWLLGIVERLPKPQRVVAEVLMAGGGRHEVADRFGISVKAADQRIKRTCAVLRAAVLAARAAALVTGLWRTRPSTRPSAPLVASVGVAVAVVLAPHHRGVTQPPEPEVSEVLAPATPLPRAQQSRPKPPPRPRAVAPTSRPSLTPHPTPSPTTTPSAAQEHTGNEDGEPPTDEKGPPNGGPVADVLWCLDNLSITPSEFPCPPP